MNANSRPINYNRSRRLPKNACILCGAKLGNFNPVNSFAVIGQGSGKLEGWICRTGCDNEEGEDGDFGYDDDDLIW